MIFLRGVLTWVGIVNASTYRNFDGKTGRYSFGASSGVLRMTSGSSGGLAYKLMPEGKLPRARPEGQYHRRQLRACAQTAD